MISLGFVGSVWLLPEVPRPSWPKRLPRFTLEAQETAQPSRVTPMEKPAEGEEEVEAKVAVGGGVAIDVGWGCREEEGKGVEGAVGSLVEYATGVYWGPGQARWTN